jgi:tetratricopeptide (TPR) repeat protein
VAARLAAAEGDRERAAFHARNALDLKPSYGEARLLLGSLMYEDASYDQAILLMREAVSQNRKDGMAWYTLGLAQAGAGKMADAIYSLKTASSLRPDDEVARIALENLVMDIYTTEDPARETYAEWHFLRGRELEDRSLHDQAFFEYRRGLRIYPYSKNGRLLYAGLLKSRGYQGKYLDELEFLKELGKADQATLDEREIYNSLLVDTVGRAWSIDESSLPKRPYRIALMYQTAAAGRIHTAGEEVLLRYVRDLLSSSSKFSVLALKARTSSFAEAFRRAREAEADYFIMISSRETEREIEIGAELHVARTGSPATSIRAFRTGNDRVKNTASRVSELIATALPPEGSILKRSQDRALFDLGKSDGIKIGDRLLILKNGSLQVKAEGLGHAYPPSALVGELEIVRIGEEASEGRLKSAGFFDTINTGDEIILAPTVDKPVAAGTGSAGATVITVPGNPVATGKQQSPEQEWPGLFSAVRRLR